MSQVETLTQFRKCEIDRKIETKSERFNICGEQLQAVYKQPGQNITSLPLKTEKFILVLSKSNLD